MMLFISENDKTPCAILDPPSNVQHWSYERAYVSQELEFRAHLVILPVQPYIFGPR